MLRYRLIVAMLAHFAALLLAVPAHAAPQHIAAELLAESAVAPGKTVTLAFRFRPEPGWHGYWSNPGDAGFGMKTRWELPSGASVGDAQYPVPQTLLIAGLMNHVFEHEYAVLVPLTVPADVRPGTTLPVRVRADWLACTDTVCVPEYADLAASVTIGTPGAADPRFAEWRRRLPAPLGAEARFAMAGATLRLAIPLPAAMPLENPHFFAAQDRLVDYPAPQRFSRNGNTLIVEISRARVQPATPGRMEGVLRLNAAGDGVIIAATPGTVPPAGTPIGAQTSGPASSMLVLLLGALAGGLLLNVMPCVFPILSLKALSLARAGESERHARAEGLAYTAGVITACAALGALLLALRAGGAEIGWAFQLQEPGVVAVLLLLAAAITANLLGLYEFSVPGFARAGAPQGAFATGLLAAFVATPCTGPFMAAAMGAALLLPVAPAMALFCTLGFGIALPFLAIAFVPALRRRLPRPGPWMVRFRRWMALPMGLTALALLWLTGRLGGPGLAAALLIFSLALVGMLAVAGTWQRRGKGVIGLVLPVSAVLFTAAAVLPSQLPAAAQVRQDMLRSRPFSEAALADALAQGRPVFAYFTADWCLTCKVNESVAIERSTTNDAFDRANVVVLRGDWTRRDPAITRFLTAHGAAGVPLYLWYPAGAKQPQQLPQVLTPETLTDLVKP